MDSSQLNPAQSFQARLDAADLTRVMKLLWALSAGLIALDGFDFFIIGVALPFVQQDFGLTAPQIGAIAVAALVGSLLGSLVLGPITDRIGRQQMLLADVALFVFATAGTTCAWNAASLIAFRFLVGVAIGADYPISVAYITENVPSRLRGRMVISAFTFQAVGALLGAVTGLLVILGFQQVFPGDPQPAIQFAWRWMLGVGLVLAIAVGILRFTFALESPRYYLAQGDYDAASKAASILLEEPITLTPANRLQGSGGIAATVPPMPYTALFSPQYRRRLLFASLPWFLQDIATYGIGIFTPTIIGALAFAQEPDFLTRELGAAKGAAVVDLFLIAGFLVAIALIERVGRVRLQIVGFLGMAIGLLILAASNGVDAHSPTHLMLVFSGFLVFNLLMNAGPNSTTFLLSGEVFPTAMRASGAGFAGAIAKAGAVVGTFALPILQQEIGVLGLLIALAMVCVLAALLTYQLRIETTGRSLEQVNETPSPAASTN